RATRTPASARSAAVKPSGHRSASAARSADPQFRQYLCRRLLFHALERRTDSAQQRRRARVRVVRQELARLNALHGATEGAYFPHKVEHRPRVVVPQRLTVLPDESHLAVLMGLPCRDVELLRLLRHTGRRKRRLDHRLALL